MKPNRKRVALRRLPLYILIGTAVLLIGTAATWAAHLLADSENGIKVTVLNYHKTEDVHNSLSVPPAEFDAQMKFLWEHNYHTISPDELYSSLSGNAELPENPVLITFDDGYEDNYLYAYPILQKYGFKATIFVISGYVGVQPHYITWQQAREMRDYGFNIESHTVSHRSMTDLTDEELKTELVESKKKIEAEMGHTVNFMAYPTGTYNLHIAQLVKDAGYKAAFTIKYGNVDKGSNVYALERVPIFQTENTHKSFRERIRYTPIFTGFGWVKN